MGNKNLSLLFGSKMNDFDSKHMYTNKTSQKINQRIKD